MIIKYKFSQARRQGVCWMAKCLATAAPSPEKVAQGRGGGGTPTHFPTPEFSAPPHLSVIYLT